MTKDITETMKHAILVIGHGENADVLQETINILDDPDIDFYIHWDKRFKCPKLTSNYSSLVFVESMKNNWGSDLQVIVEKRLLEAVADKNYAYIHLISAQDMPLMTPKCFKDFFKNDVYLGFFKMNGLEERVKYYYPVRYLNLRKKPFLLKKVFVKGYITVQKLLKVDRLKNYQGSLKKGSNWFSFKGKYIKRVLNFEDSLFMHSFLADELYIQTILNEFENDPKNIGNARYIDWDRGRPYTFTIDDIAELKALVNTKYCFARKVADSEVVKQVFV